MDDRQIKMINFLRDEVSEFRQVKNDNYDELLAFFYPDDIKEFMSILDQGYFDDGGVDATLNGSDVVVDIKDILNNAGIDIRLVYPEWEERN